MSEFLKLSRKVVLHDKMNEAIEEYKKAELEYALDICPFSVGEETTILGYSHNGKKGIIDKIKGLHGSGWQGRWEVSGVVLKKDGSKGCKFFDFNEDQYRDSLRKAVK